MDQEDIKAHVFHHFKYLYMDNKETTSLAHADLLSKIPSLITKQDDKDLSKPIMEYEIKAAIWSLQANKALGPDGFTINFYREAWDTIKEDMKRMLNWMRRKDKVGGPPTLPFSLSYQKKNNPVQ